MISRKTTLLIADAISEVFTETKHGVKFDERSPFGRRRSGTRTETKTLSEELRDFLFEYDADGYTVNQLNKTYGKTTLKESILNMATGRFYHSYQPSSYKTKGQEDLKAIATGILSNKEMFKSYVVELENLLRMDGYIFEDDSLYSINTDVHDKFSIIEVKYKQLGLNKEVEFNTFYKNMNNHFETSKWTDAIHNSRQLCEIALSECAKKYSANVIKDNQINGTEQPVKIRLYLESNNFFSDEESKIVQYFYNYISNNGGHPKLAVKEQADFSRVIAINICLYALNRLESFK